MHVATKMAVGLQRRIGNAPTKIDVQLRPPDQNHTAILWPLASVIGAQIRESLKCAILVPKLALRQSQFERFEVGKRPRRHL